MERIVVWGTGKIAKELIDKFHLLDRFEVIGFIDNYPDGRDSYCGINLYSPEVIRRLEFDKAVIAIHDWKDVWTQIEEQYPDVLDRVVSAQYIYKKGVRERYSDSSDPEICEVLEYIDNHDITFMPYDYVDEYLHKEVDVYFDNSCGLFYVYRNSKKMYFSRCFDSESKVREYYRGICAEQDEMSPHRYLSKDCNVKNGDVIVDIGAAEGFFALDMVERASKIYIIEGDSDWITALQHTFNPFADKVEIIKAYVSSINDGMYSKLDSLIHDDINFVKMDIEGYEWDSLVGMRRLMKTGKDVRCAICSYHRPFDELLIKEVLSLYGFQTSTTKGYLWFGGLSNCKYGDDSSWLVRGIVYGTKRT